MTGRAPSIRTLAQLSRLSNLPTCVSNVLVGAAIAAAHVNEPGVDRINEILIALVAVAVGLFYVAGMALKDVFDAPVDAEERVDRPIPSGRISRRTASGFVFTAVAAGLLVLLATAPQAWWPALALLVAIALYDWLHKKHPAAIFLMGACRALVYVLAAVAVGGNSMSADAWIQITLFAVLIAFYTIGITIIARIEVTEKMDNRRHLAPVMVAAVLFAAVVSPPAAWYWMVIAGVVMALWLALAALWVFRTPPAAKQAVLAFLSGMCLVGGDFLTLLDRPIWSLIAAACFIITALGHRRIAGT